MIILCEAYVSFEKNDGDNYNDLARNTLENAAPLVNQVLYAYQPRVTVRAAGKPARVWVTVAGPVAALIAHGRVRETVGAVLRSGQRVTSALNERLRADPSFLGQPAIRIQRRAGLPGAIERLFKAVERGALPTEIAASRAVTLVLRATGPGEISEAPGLLQLIAAELHALEPLFGSPNLTGAARLPQHYPKPRPTSKPIGAIAWVEPASASVQVASY